LNVSVEVEVEVDVAGKDAGVSSIESASIALSTSASKKRLSLSQ